MTQGLIPGCSIPLLGAIDPGVTGALVRNTCDGEMEYIKMPSDGSGTDLLAVRDYFQGVDMVILEHPPLGGFQGHTQSSENSCFSQYLLLLGFLKGAGIEVYTIRPQAWQKLLNFPQKRRDVGEDQWKDFLWDQSQQRFPTVKKLYKYAADAFLLHRVLSQLWYKDRSEWPSDKPKKKKAKKKTA